MSSMKRVVTSFSKILLILTATTTNTIENIYDEKCTKENAKYSDNSLFKAKLKYVRDNNADSNMQISVRYNVCLYMCV